MQVCSIMELLRMMKYNLDGFGWFDSLEKGERTYSPFFLMTRDIVILSGNVMRGSVFM